MKNKGFLKQIQFFFSSVVCFLYLQYICFVFAALSAESEAQVGQILCVEKQFVHMYILQYIYIYACGSSQLVCGQSKTLLNIFQCMVSISKSMQLTSKNKTQRADYLSNKPQIVEFKSKKTQIAEFNPTNPNI